MEKLPTVLLLLMDGGVVMAVEGWIDGVQGYLETDKFHKFIHPITNQPYLVNCQKVISVQEVPRDSIHMGSGNLIVPGGGRVH